MSGYVRALAQAARAAQLQIAALSGAQRLSLIHI